MAPEVGLVFSRLSDHHHWLPLLRAWMRTDGGSLDKLGIKASVKSLPCPDDALDWRAEFPDERLVVTFGFTPQQIEALHNFNISGEPIIVSSLNPVMASNLASASFLNKQSLVTSSNVKQQIRKSLIRVALRKRVKIRPPISDQEFADYFALRYQVWDAAGWLRDQNREAQNKWEIDHWDRTAVPLVALTPNGRVIACARLIRNLGEEEQPYCGRIQKLLAKTNDPVLSRLFDFPNSVQQPFDVLHEFRGFRAHYRTLMQCGKKAAEVGRVAVHPDFRGQFISEVVVDTAVSYAEKKRVSCLFLACMEELEPLYSKCGFRPVPGLRCEKFFNIPLPSIVMEMRL
jgi:predicted GNAT family N-acyltransferase